MIYFSEKAVEEVAKLFYGSQTGTPGERVLTSCYRDQWFKLAHAALKVAVPHMTEEDASV